MEHRAVGFGASAILIPAWCASFSRSRFRPASTPRPVGPSLPTRVESIVDSIRRCCTYSWPPWASSPPSPCRRAAPAAALACFPVLVPTAVPFDKLGAATADLTLFRQIGGTVGLTFGFTLFRSFLTADLLKEQFGKAGVPAQVLANMPSGGSFGGDVAQVGGADPVQQFLAQAPAQAQPALQQYLANFEAGFHQAFSIALANSLWLGVGAMVLGVTATLFLNELPLRRHHGAAPAMTEGSEPAPMVALD